MAEIVSFNKWRGKRGAANGADSTKSSQQSAKTTPPGEPESDAGLPLDAITGMLTRLGIEDVRFQVIVPMLKYLNSLQGRVSWQLVEEKKAELRKLSDDELKNIAKAGTEQLWQTHPAFYYALAHVIEQRNIN